MVFIGIRWSPRIGEDMWRVINKAVGGDSWWIVGGWFIPLIRGHLRHWAQP